MYATNKAYAKDLVLVLTFHLAERIATLLRQVLDHPTKVLYDPELAKFNEWFGSMSLMHGAISKRNQMWLQHSVHRDPTMNASEVENGPASREMKYKIQKWNVKSKEVRPILAANARLDWMSLDDSDLIQQFQILREGRMFSLNVRLRHGKECNRKDSQCRSCYQAVAQLTNSWISCNYSDSFGRL